MLKLFSSIMKTNLETMLKRQAYKEMLLSYGIQIKLFGIWYNQHTIVNMFQNELEMFEQKERKQLNFHGVSFSWGVSFSRGFCPK